MLIIEGAFTCAKKIYRIETELQSNAKLKDSDTVLVIDGYDVLLMPIFLRVMKVICLIHEGWTLR